MPVWAKIVVECQQYTSHILEQHAEDILLLSHKELEPNWAGWQTAVTSMFWEAEARGPQVWVQYGQLSHLRRISVKNNEF